MSRNQSTLQKYAIDRRGLSFSNITQDTWICRKSQTKQLCCLVFVLTATTLVSSLPELRAQNSDKDTCLAREGHASIVGVEYTASYESKLFVTKDEVARYVFLTNANYDGDRSVALYRAPGKKGSVAGDYWATATVASGSLGGKDNRATTVRRSEAPLPISTTKAVHELWLAMLEGSRIDEKAIPLAPTALISATTARGVRLKAVTVAGGSDSPCLAFSLALMRFGQSLINYPQLPASKRIEAARELEKEANGLLTRVRQANKR
jgi:hypothetical protein